MAEDVQKKVGDKVKGLVRGDITDLPVEAFVFDITPDCKLGSGYGGAIAQRAGKVVQKELDAIGNLATGNAVVTTAGKMKAQHIIHVNGPKFNEADTKAKLERATISALDRAVERGIKQLAFPPIGTGLYQVPLDMCVDIMVDTVASHLQGPTSLKDVVFVALDTREYKPFEAKIQGGS